MLSVASDWSPRSLRGRPVCARDRQRRNTRTPKRRCKEPINDARDVADELKRDGFSVEVGENLTGEAMRRAFDKLYGTHQAGLGRADLLQRVRRPVRPPELHDPGRCARSGPKPDVRRDGFSLETVLGEINGRGAGVKIALIDASRRNPVRAPVPQLFPPALRR